MFLMRYCFSYGFLVSCCCLLGLWFNRQYIRVLTPCLHRLGPQVVSEARLESKRLAYVFPTRGLDIERWADVNSVCHNQNGPVSFLTRPVVDSHFCGTLPTAAASFSSNNTDWFGLILAAEQFRLGSPRFEDLKCFHFNHFIDLAGSMIPKLLDTNTWMESTFVYSCLRRVHYVVCCIFLAFNLIWFNSEACQWTTCDSTRLE